jgi:hypothetical protein
MSKRTTSTSKSRPIGMDKRVPKGASANQLTQRNVEAILQLEKAAREERTGSDLVAEMSLTSAAA